MVRSKRNTKTTVAKRDGTSRTQANGAGKPKPAIIYPSSIRKPFFDVKLVDKATAEVMARIVCLFPKGIYEFTNGNLGQIFNTPTLQEAIKWSGNPGDAVKKGGKSYGSQMFKAFKKKVAGMLPTGKLTESWGLQMGSQQGCLRRQKTSCVHAQNNKAITASQIADLVAMNSKLTAKLKRSAECEQETIGNLKAEHHAEVATLKAEIATLKAKHQPEITIIGGGHPDAGASAHSLVFNDHFTLDLLASDTQSANPCLVDPQMTIADGPGQLLPWQLQMHP